MTDNDAMRAPLASDGDTPPARFIDMWLHPWRTHMMLRRMASDLAYIPTLRRALAEVDAMLEAQRCENTALLARNTDMAVRLQQLSRELAATRQALEDAQQRIEEYGELERNLTEFADQLQGAEVMKRNYEQRIRTLRAQLRDARDALKTVTGIDYSDDLKVIDMDRAPAPSSLPAALRPPQVPEPQPEPPQAEIPPPVPHTVPRRKRKPSPWLPPADQRIGADDSEWLADLPSGS